MSFYAVKIAVICGLAALMMAAGGPAAAQQAIQFSKPANQDPTAAANAFLPSSARKSPGAFNAPNSFFGNGDDMMPSIPPPVMPNPNAAQWQRVLQERKNWTLMTPEQILGVPTPESILGLVDPQEDPKLSPEQRYLQRQERLTQTSVSNSMVRANASLWQNDNAATGFSPGADGNNVFGDVSGDNGTKRGSSAPGAIRASNPFFNPGPKSPGNVADRVDSPWTSAFDSPAPIPQSSPEQLAGMDRFRALMEPPPPQPASASPFGTPVAPAPDPFLQALPADFNPNGRAATALQSDFGKPMGIAPLPGITGPIPVPAKAASLVQTPPWMSQTPKIGTLQQRQF